MEIERIVKMERFDYPSVMAVLMEHMPREAYGSQVALLDLLYAGYVEDTGHVFDNGQVNKWLKGKERFSPKVSTYYMEQKHRYDLCAAIEGKLLPMMDDPAMAAQELYELLIQDGGVSEQKKAELSEGSDFENLEEIAVFLTQLLCFAMTRKLEKHMANRAAGLSPVTRERILGGKIPLLCKWFQGREREIEHLHELLMAEDKVFLHGIPGIGKSEMAKAYVKRYRNEYTNVLYLAYGGALRHAIAELEFSDDLSTDDEDRRFQKHDRYLRTLKEDTLLIIDNFNTMPEEEPFFDAVLDYRCRILFTTRNRFEDRASLELRELDAESLFQVVEHLYGAAEQNRTVVSDIIQILHCHTFAVELAARLLEKGILKPTALRRKLRLERAAMDAADLIRTLKDGKSSRATYHDHIRTLFALFRLSPKKKDILRNMTLTPETGVDAKTFARWLKLPDLNGINELIELGLIRPEREQKILLHPMICEAALDELPPSIRKCHVLIESIHWICRLHGMEEPHYRQMFRIVEGIMEEAEKDDAPAYLLFLEDVFLYMEKYHYETGMRRILEEMESLLEKDSFGTASDRALVLDYRAAMKKSKPRAIELEIEAIRLLGEVDQKTAHLAANLHSNLGGLYHQVGRIDLAKLHMEQGWFLLREYDLLHYHDSITQVVNYAMLLSETKEFDRGIEALNKVDAYLREGALEDTLDYAWVQESLALLHMMAGHMQTGLDHYRKCIAIWKHIFADEPERVAEKESQIQRNCLKAGVYLARRLSGEL